MAISDAELKKISNIAKIQQALSTLENSFDTVKNNKAILKEDIDLKIRVQLLKDRISDLLDNI